MALIDLWHSDRDQFGVKRVDQLIAFAGEGRLRDGNSTSREFRELLNVTSSELIGRWLDECLENRFQDFGFVLQDLVNEIGRRLGFNVTNGVYRGHTNEGYDGLWKLADGRAILVEAKSSTAYSIDLDRISEYRNQAAPLVRTSPQNISILIVVGPEETASFEAQVRGSRYAWDVRILGVKALYRLLKLRETLDDENVERQIQGILLPQEFTRLDSIIDLVFATAEDAQVNDGPEIDTAVDDVPAARDIAPAAFHADVLPKLEEFFKQPLVKRSRVLWISRDESVLVSCQVSKHFGKGKLDYWFGLKRSTKETLKKHGNAFCAFALGTPDKVAVMPFSELAKFLDGMFTSPDEDQGIRHWHVRFSNTQGGVSY
ncbi:MAG TPA: hypothetical protein VHD36_23385 [Pirellulales bacterium]|nr:hypothetical protein [Pirellulales bacterium]